MSSSRKPSQTFPGLAKVLPLCPHDILSFPYPNIDLNQELHVPIVLGTGRGLRLAFGSVVPQGWSPNTC